MASYVATVSAISSLATDVTDIINGYETLLEKAETDLQPAVERLLELHRAHVAELNQIHASLGGDPSQNGSMMGAVHTAVAHVRDFAGALDRSALDGILDGEGRLLSTYETALDQVAGQQEFSEVLAAQHAALASHVDALRS